MISKKAEIGNNVNIGPYAIIQADVVIGDNCEIMAHAYIDRYTKLGNGVKVFPSAVLGTVPQDLKFGGEVTSLEIGDNTVIREFAMLSRGTKHSWKTVVGKNTLIMAYVHLGHDVVVGDNVVLANAVQIAGHVVIGDWVGLGGTVAVHQFCHIGDHAFIEGVSKVKKDVPPYILAMSIPLSYGGVNSVGLKRRGFTEEQIATIRKAYKIYFKSGLNATQALKKIDEELPKTPEIEKIIYFLENTERGTIRK
jgi:UDP-N-acetylglucosamine acyltransferase